MGNLENIEDALQALSTDSSCEFALIKHPLSENFVQFISIGGGLLLDMPSQQLSKVEVARARDFFATLGAQETKASGIATYNLQFDSAAADVNRAATTVLRLFDEIFQYEEAYVVEIELAGC
jgi:hypothetical protein